MYPLRRLHVLLPLVLGQARVRRTGGHRPGPSFHLRLSRRRRGRAARDTGRRGRRVALPNDLQLRRCLPARYQHHQGDPGGLLGNRGATRLSGPKDPEWDSLWSSVGAGTDGAAPEPNDPAQPNAAAAASSPSQMRLIVRTDGAARGNPGPASLGAVLIDASAPGARRPDAVPLASISEYLGVQTNNVAEYTAVLRALALALELGAREVEMLLDSKLIVEQLHGRWRVKDAKLIPLHAEARSHLASFARWGATHVPPAWTRSMASLQRASACLFWARGTWVAPQRAKLARCDLASAWSGISLASLTRQRPWSCSTMSLESSSISTSRAPSSRARARARSTAVYSATLFV